MIRLGLVGVGSWGQRYMATVGQRDDCRFVAFARARGTSDVPIPGARAESSEALIERARNGELDALVVATTPDHQAEVARAAVLAGVPAVVEKPLGVSREAAQRVFDAVRESESAPPLAVNYVQLYTPGHRALRGLVRDANVPVVSIASEGSNRGPIRSFSSLYDYGPHDLSLCLDLLGQDSAFRLEHAQKSAGEGGGELYDTSFFLGDVRVSMRVGNGATTKARRFSVTLSSGRTLTHDNLAKPEVALVDAGKAVPVGGTLPLDVMLTEFFQRYERWKTGDRDRTRELREAEFSVRINEILDSIAAACS